MKHLFAYGTLMCEDIMLEVSGCCLAHVLGILKGYSRRPVKGEHYPAIFPDREGNVVGVVYLNVPDSAWERLDRFEGDMYARELVEIAVYEGETLSAAAYVVRPQFIHLLDGSEWDFDEFLRIGKADFQNLYKGYRSI